MKQSVRSIVLAAGKSTRLHTGRTKLVEKICGQEMILYATKLLQKINMPTTVVVGYDKDKVIKTITSNHNQYFTFIEQKEQLGTGHALAITSDTWDTDHILILNGDIPLITPEIISQLYTEHTENKSAISFVVSYLEEPNHPYGRVFTEDGHVSIVEARDLELNDPRQDHPWFNAGIYLVNTKFLQDSISKLTTNNAQNEFYITDLINIANKEEKTITTVHAPFDSVRGINTFEELWMVENIKQAQLISYWMDKGVRFSAAKNIHIDMQVSIGAGSYIGCGVHLRGNTTIGTNSSIHEFSCIQDSHVGNNVQVYSHSIITNTTIENKSKIGPFTHLLNNVMLDKDLPIETLTQTSTPKKNNSKYTAHTNHTQQTSSTIEAQTESKKYCNITTVTEKNTKKKGATFFMGARMLQEDFAFHED